LTTKEPHDRLDDAIDRTVRGMTDATTDDRAVARVMARVRETDTRAGETWWMLSPRVAWSGVLALLLMALVSRYSWHPLQRNTEEQRASGTALQPASVQQPPLAAREFPTRVADAPSSTQATAAMAAAARIARRDTLMPASVANDAVDANDRGREERNAQVEFPPFESDIVLASITPAPLDEPPAIPVEPLSTSSLTVDAIPLSSIEMPPVSPEQQK
jgi:hypothetical protein